MDRYSRRDFLRTAAAATLGGMAVPACASLMQKEEPIVGPPNVVFILVDQCRFDVLSAAGNTVLHTPNLDRLASEGVRFTQATCASPLCGPSRAAILTGRVLARHGCYRNRFPDQDGGMREDVPTFDEVLHAAGYVCEYHGKWHTGSGHRAVYRDGVPHYSEIYRKEMAARFPDLAGDSRAGMVRDKRYTGLLYHPWSVDGMMRTARKRGFRMPHHPEAGESDLPEDASLTVWTASRAIRFLRSGPAQPFSLTCSILHPHAPLVAVKPYSRMFDPARMPMPVNVEDDQALPVGARCVPGAVPLTPEGLGTFIALYYGLVAEVDHWVGEILKALRESGLERNTLVLFTSDHGEMMGSHGTLSKGVFYEEAFRVPLILRLPGRIPAGRKLDVPASGFDLAPTILDYCGVAPPREGFAGRSLRKVMEGRDDGVQYAFGELGRPRQKRRAVRCREWKLIFRRNRSPRLFNLLEDPGEQRNVLHEPRPSSEGVHAAEALREALVAFMTENGDPLAEQLAEEALRAGSAEGRQP